jgi:hypothetical protein
MNGLNLNLALICLTVIALVAIVYGKTDLAEKAIAGLNSLVSEALRLLERMR